MAGTYQVVLTQRAKDNINELLEYLLDNVSYGEAADARRQIIDGIHSLSEMPEARSPVQEMVEITKSIVFRQIVVKKAYRIIFRIREVQKNVVVIRVIHVKRGSDFVIETLS